MELAVNGTFKIYKRHCLGGEDYRVLTRLYLPIIGVDSFGLYHLLSVIDESETHAFKFLLDSLNFPRLPIWTGLFPNSKRYRLLPCTTANKKTRTCFR